MPEFTMSQYATKEDLHKAEAEYFKALAYAALNRLADLEEVQRDDDGEWIWRSCGEYVKDYA